jgi:hypothetical protein
MTVDIAMLSERMRAVILWMPRSTYSRHWGEITESFGPRASFHNTLRPLIGRGLLARSPGEPYFGCYRLTAAGEEARALLLKDNSDAG